MIKNRALPRLPYQLFPFSQKSRVGISILFNAAASFLPIIEETAADVKTCAPKTAAVIVWDVALPQPLLQRKGARYEKILCF